MLVEAEVGTALGVTETHTTAAIHSALQRADLPHEIVFDDAAVVIDATRSDKKVRSGAVRYVLLEKAGSVARSDTGDWTWEVPDDVVREALRQFSV
jgi:3-dehydroquinate synthetase